MTTAPRKQPMIGRALHSLAKAGWTAPIIFAEPHALIPAEFQHLTVVRRPHTLGAFRNWLSALGALLESAPDAGAYLLIQDDIVWSRNVRQRLERDLWPHPDTGAVSLFRSECYKPGPPGIQQLQVDPAGVIGAQALCFPPASLKMLFNTSLTKTWQRPDGIDALLGGWLCHTERPYFSYTPSLAQHVGHTSTLDHPFDAWGMVANDFMGEDWDADG